ncbi:aminoacyl-tRNA hydrolase [bacterium]|nr:aminoacyl-tRNA hydrolase [bacterium]
MKLVVGLGNIGEKYFFTRHNVGFMVVDKFVMSQNISFKEDKKLKCFITKFKFGDEDLIVIKPTTFMNLSGEAVQLVMNYYKISPDNVLVIYDDLSLELGKMRFRANGSDGGHNGIKSVIKCVGTSDIARLKIGIGPQPPIPSEVFVLKNFTSEQLDELKSVIKKAVSGIEFYLENGMQKTQNSFN